MTKIGFVAKLTPFISDEELMHPIFFVREFMIVFLLPAIKFKPVEENVHEECEVSGRDEQMRNSAILFLQLMNEIFDALLGGRSPDWLGECYRSKYLLISSEGKTNMEEVQRPKLNLFLPG